MTIHTDTQMTGSRGMMRACAPFAVEWYLNVHTEHAVLRVVPWQLQRVWLCQYLVAYLPQDHAHIAWCNRGFI